MGECSVSVAVNTFVPSLHKYLEVNAKYPSLSFIFETKFDCLNRDNALQNFCPSPNIFSLLRNKTGSLVEYLASMREIRDECKILVGKSAGSQLLGRAGHRRENNSKIRDHSLYLLSVRTQLLEHCTLNCNLLHVLAVWPSSGRVYNIRRKEYREEGLDLDFLFHVCCRKVNLMLDK